MKRKSKKPEPEGSLIGPPQGGPPRTALGSSKPDDDCDIVFEATSESVLITILVDNVGWRHAKLLKLFNESEQDTSAPHWTG